MYNDYYVYGHYDAVTHDILYIGKGRLQRHNSVGNRSKKWREYTNKNKWYSVILFSGMDEDQALDKEQELITLIEPKLNTLKVSKRFCLEAVNFSNFFYYDETSPSSLRWKTHNGQTNKCKRYQGDVAGHSSVNKYGNDQGFKVGLGGKEYKVHRIIWKLLNPTESLDGLVIDHVDGNPSNNKINNLRCITLSVNSRNTKLRSDNKVGFMGIDLFYSDNKYLMYRAKCKVNNRAISKSFAVTKYGLLPAFAMACQWREDKIKELNEQGAGYTERHGT